MVDAHWEEKTERDTKRFGELVAAQIRAAGETYSAYLTSKNEYHSMQQNNNT